MISTIKSIILADQWSSENYIWDINNFLHPCVYGVDIVRRINMCNIALNNSFNLEYYYFRTVNDLINLLLSENHK